LLGYQPWQKSGGEWGDGEEAIIDSLGLQYAVNKEYFA
jgi:hypothetical protein